MSYRLRLDAPAKKKLRKLKPPVSVAVVRKLAILRDNPRPPGVLKLTGTKKTGWRVRVGKIRILFEIDDAEQLITVYDIDLRDDVYQEK